MSRPVGFRHILITFLKADVAQQVSTERIMTSKFDMLPPAANTSAVQIGSKDVTTAWVSRAKGSVHSFVAADGGDMTSGNYFDLSKLYVVSATAGDTCIFEYLALED